MIVTTDTHDHCRTITINRPDKLNALNAAVIDALDVAFQEAFNDDDVRCIVLKGSGEKAFVAGADIKEISAMSGAQAQYFSAKGQAMMQRMDESTKPIIAKIQGFALGGGLELAMACHLRIASSKAKLGLPEITLGLLPGFGGTQRMVKLCGRARAMELCLTGAMIDAETAQNDGLLHQVVEPEALTETVNKLAGKLAKSAPIAIKHILLTMRAAEELPMHAGLAFESTAFGVCASTEDMREGTAAFLEKRKPTFTGK